jgi:hypothetical protein
MTKDYLIYDPVSKEINLLSIAEEQLPYNTNGGKWIAVELDGRFRTVATNRAGRPVESFNYDAVRNPLLRKIDAAAEALRGSVAASQASIYAAKEAEARDLKGPTPYLDSEAKARGVTRAELATAVLANADAARAISISTEAKRTAAKAAVRSETSIPKMIAAAMVDWDA